MLSHEVQCITRMVQLGAINKYQHLLRTEYFNETNREIYEALAFYEREYGVCMDEPTFRDQFPSFDWTPSDVQVEYLADELQQSYVESQVTKVLQDAQETLAENPRDVARKTLESLQEITVKHATNTGSGVDLITAGLDRVEEIRRRRSTRRISGVTLGFRLLDEVCNGTQPGDIELWVARPGRGKSVSLGYSALEAWKDGNRVSIVSPEMSEMEWGLRLDSMLYHVSIMRMMGGKLSDDELAALADQQAEMREDLERDIRFRDPFKLGRRFTTGDIRNIIETDSPNIVCIDGIMLLEPIDRKYRDTRTKMINVMEELKAITMETQIPIRAAHQANRESEKSNTRKKEQRVDDTIPMLHQLAESGATEQYSSRVICMRYDSATKQLYYAVRKNRNGPEGRIVSVKFDIDCGYVTKEEDVTDMLAASDEHAKGKDPELDF